MWSATNVTDQDSIANVSPVSHTVYMVEGPKAPVTTSPALGRVATMTPTGTTVIPPHIILTSLINTVLEPILLLLILTTVTTLALVAT